MTFDELCQKIRRDEYENKNSKKKELKLILEKEIKDALTDKQLLELFSALEQNPRITEISFSKRLRTNEQIIKIANFIAKNKTLKSLGLSNAGPQFDLTINNEAFTALASALMENNTLISLDLRSNQSKIDNPVIKAFADALEKNATLEILNIGRNDIEADITPIATTLTLKNKTLRELDLANRNTPMGPGVGLVFAEAFAAGMCLTKLNLANNNIGPDSAIALAKALIENTDLCELNLEHNNLGPKGGLAFVEVLSEMLPNNTTLTRLNLSFNWIGNVAAITLANALKNRTFEELNIDWNNIDDEGIKPFSKVSIKILSAASNEITQTGAINLSKNHDISKLNLFANKIDYYGIIGLAEAPLKKLKLGNNPMYFAPPHLRNAFSKNESLTYLEPVQLINDDKNKAQTHLAENYDKVTRENRFWLTAFASRLAAQKSSEIFEPKVLNIISEMSENSEEKDKYGIF